MRPHAEGQKEPGFTQSLRDKYAQLSKGREDRPPSPLSQCIAAAVLGRPVINMPQVDTPLQLKLA